MSTVITDKKTNNTKLNELEQIKKFTTVVADTADFESIREFKPQDATTNPSLVYAATQKVKYSHFLEEVLVDRRNSGTGNWARARPHQDCFDVGRDHGGGTTAEGRDQMQYDVAVLSPAGRASCGSEGATHFAIRRTDLRLV